MLDENSTPHTSPFDAIRHIDEDSNEYWSARELYKVLGYSRWEKFRETIERAKEELSTPEKSIRQLERELTERRTQAPRTSISARVALAFGADQ